MKGEIEREHRAQAQLPVFRLNFRYSGSTSGSQISGFAKWRTGSSEEAAVIMQGAVSLTGRIKPVLVPLSAQLHVFLNVKSRVDDWNSEVQELWFEKFLPSQDQVVPRTRIRFDSCPGH